MRGEPTPSLTTKPLHILLVLSKKKEGEYRGQLKGGIREGKGAIFWSNGDVYTGDFHNGLRHGQGAWFVLPLTFAQQPPPDCQVTWSFFYVYRNEVREIRS